MSRVKQLLTNKSPFSAWHSVMRNGAHTKMPYRQAVPRVENTPPRLGKTHQRSQPEQHVFENALLLACPVRSNRHITA